MFSLFGAPALSQFRLDQLLRALQAAGSARHRRSSALAAFRRRLAPSGRRRTGAARQAADLRRRVPTLRRSAAGQRVLVTPRVGTESPWSSKATDIVHVCGLRGGQARRARHGVFHRIAAPLEASELQALAAHLHDRMTESIWIDSIDPQGLFHGAAARPLRIVALGGDGHAALGTRQPRLGPGAVERRDRLPGAGVRPLGSAIPPMSSS